ncbi:tetratricopeptide repeat protein [uncultured Paenalcaligenes sp.]|uniref:tetratricopeptide repeat protein n=1 Tax=uncultured Paenalcaligenes sp. TaxID=1588925 RepID=UPI00262E47E6|nr:tetratricopeptide repeat protein [uncultured Paenalcaligenes sp.]
MRNVLLGIMCALTLGLAQPVLAQSAEFQQLKAEAMKGDSDSQLELGVMYEQGDGVEQSYAKAKEFFERAAQQDHPEAQFNLGIMYEHGEGMPKNKKQAIEWYSKACENGDEDGCAAAQRLDRRLF